MTKCYEELTYANFYVSVVLEGLSLMFLVFVGGSSYVKYQRPFLPSQVFEIGCVYGIILTVLTQCLKDVSKAHINPAITLANVLTRRISLLRGCCYIVFQFIGGKYKFRESTLLFSNSIFFYGYHALFLRSQTCREEMITIT